MNNKKKQQPHVTRAQPHTPTHCPSLPPDKLSGGSVSAIVECIDLAEQCQLDSLYTKCVLRLAARLCTPGGDGDGFSHAASLGAMDKGTILLTLGALAEAARRTSQSYGTYG